ncbi:MAG: HPr kinase/phosphatase C-terminal domain-containing protein [Candidatus Sphingomonas colombiensis]|nr:HPr kinase/phosphatase C-terminal domain-containing protein [Sphingomonas sp.]WEK42742.1 MAG: HPr kinase/phosphatase C-terminal domain-containing protein [Sphingomonas sp.]
MPDRETVHATTVAIDGCAVLLIGPSGAGKSDLALRLIDRGATLVSDDYTDLVASADALFASPPPSIAGRMEVRGIGIVELPHVAAIPVILAVRLDARVERMPEPATCTLAERAIPAIAVNPFEASAPIKIELVMRRISS